MGFDLTGLGSVADFASTVITRFFPEKMSEADRAQAQIALQEMLEARENKVIDAQREVMVAEMNQGDTYTKRARPTIVYAGLFFILLVHVVLPVFSYVHILVTGSPPPEGVPDLALPGEFWATWGGVCGIWILGRSAEKRGIANKAVALITGGKR